VTAAFSGLLAVAFGDIFEALTAAFIVVLGIAALAAAPNDLASIVQWLGYSTAVASFLAACFAVVIWIVIKVAG
jgi:hypothetical protein